MKERTELEGLEATTLEVAAKKAIDAGHKGATAEAGPWLLTIDYTTYSAVLSFAKSRELRKKFYIAYRRLAADGKTDNTEIIKQILKNRQEMSQLLGFRTFSDQAFLSKVGGVCVERFKACAIAVASRSCCVVSHQQCAVPVARSRQSLSEATGCSAMADRGRGLLCSPSCTVERSSFWHRHSTRSRAQLTCAPCTALPSC